MLSLWPYFSKRLFHLYAIFFFMVAKTNELQSFQVGEATNQYFNLIHLLESKGFCIDHQLAEHAAMDAFVKTVDPAGHLLDSEQLEQIKARQNQSHSLVENWILSDAICYIKLNGIYPGSGKKISETIKKCSADQCFGLVLDLRNTGGQDMSSFSEIAGLFGNSEELVLQIQNLQGETTCVYRVQNTNTFNRPTMVLMNTETTGAAEALCAYFSSTDANAMLFGEVTRGDMGLREYMPLGKNDWVYLVDRTFTFPGNKKYTGLEGVEPDVFVATTETSFRENFSEKPSDWDPVLRRAVDVLLGLKALNINIYDLDTVPAD